LSPHGGYSIRTPEDCLYYSLNGTGHIFLCLLLQMRAAFLRGPADLLCLLLHLCQPVFSPLFHEFRDAKPAFLEMQLRLLLGLTYLIGCPVANLFLLRSELLLGPLYDWDE
jgi:hypothetical protein